MKILIAITFLLTSDFCFSNPYWVKQQSPTTQHLRDCIFLNSSTGWISGDSGFISRTTNSGSNWQDQHTGTNKEILDLFFLNERLGWALFVDPQTKNFLKSGTTILKTTNGGDVWTHYNFPDSTIYLSSICFIDSLKGVAGSFPYFMHYTTDGGNTWIKSISDSISLNGFPVLRIKFVNSTTGYACGGIRDLGGIVWKTTNSGVNWKPKTLGPDNLNDIYVVNPDSLFVLSGDFKFGASYFTTADGGNNWHLGELGYFGICSSIDFRTQTEGWISLGYGQKFFYTRNGGANWSMIDTPDSTAIFDIAFVDSAIGWAVGDAGAILKYNLKTSVHNFANGNLSDKYFTLYQNYPNPFNPETTIEYDLTENSKVSLQIFDNRGRLIETYLNESQPAGNHSINFSASELASGIYFYTIEVSTQMGNKSYETKKMLFIK